MPELPEVEIIRLFLESKIIGKKIRRTQILNAKSFFGDPQMIRHQKIIHLQRQGKQLSIHFENGLLLLIHLKMTGQIIFVDQAKTTLGHPTPTLNDAPLPHKSTRIVFNLDDGSTLYFNDQRKFGWIRLMDQASLNQFQKDLGIDTLDPKFTPEYFLNQVKTSSRSIKLVLLDQSRFAGIGNIYANDALFISRLHPLSVAKNIPKSLVLKLHQNIKNLLSESIAHGGSTAKDNKYIHPDGSFGQHQYHFRVYQKAGEACPNNCGGTIQRLKFANRSIFYCPKCQKRY